MKILVCIKQVIDTGAALKIENSRVDGEALPRVINPYDEFAIQEAVKIKEADPETSITLLTLGPEKFKDSLRTGLAMGADEAVHLIDQEFENLDSLGVAHALSQAASKAGFDLILCGRQAVDDDMAQVGPAMAVLLDVPCLTVITKLDFADDKQSATVTRQVEGGSETYEIGLPCVLTCQKGLNQPRLPSLKGIMKAKKKEITVWDAAAIEFNKEHYGAGTNRVEQMELTPPPARKKGVILEGSTQESCAELARLLREEVKVI